MGKGKEIHFQGKSAYEHLKEARKKGAKASEEIHGAELAGHIFAYLDALKDSTLCAMIFWEFSLFFPIPFWSLLFFLFGLMLWKTVRSALLGWSRIERLHRLIEEERWEIEHHRENEKAELIEMYQAKGFQGKLLEDVVTILMADDNRLLQVMLQEELGLSLEFLEHPLKQSLGAFLGVLSALVVLSFAALYHFYIFVAAGSFLIGSASFACAKWEKNKKAQAVIWNISGAAVVLVCLYFAIAFLTPLS